ncbi:MAG: LacI family DNA-binding transcriptional regulator [Rhizobacter sp.]|nr:LacI family DNA-binding transcriptional regulator [Ferruginibacter sp.]
MSATKLKDIASALGLSYSTVSRALKDNYRISEETRNRVKAYADKIKYKPNLAAQSLRNNRTRSIGVLVSNISNSFFSEVLDGIESIGYEKNYQVMITQSLESPENELKQMENLISRSVDGLLVSLCSTSNSVELLKETHLSGTPVVFFDRISALFETHKVVADNCGGSYNLTKHLLENGYKKIAHITSSPELSIAIERLEGYKKALAEYNVPFDEELVKHCLHGGMLIEETEKAVDELLKLEKSPDAIMTASDRITINTITILHNKNIAIPEKIAVAGFSNFSAPQIIAPPLTTIRQPAFEMGKMAAELLIRLIESKKPVDAFEKIILETELVVRKSTIRKR